VSETRNPEPLLVGVPVAAGMLGISTRSAWSLVAARELETVHQGRRRLVVRASIDALVERLRAAEGS
jgi:hypothetical protein